jgi:succinylglutamic semialdehyde dehydrogenase
MPNVPPVEGELTSRSPADLDDLVGVFPYSVADAERAVTRARTAQPAWAHLSLDERLGFLAALRARFLARASEIATLLCREVGKPRWEAAQEAALLPAKIDSFLSEGLPLVRSQAPQGAHGEWRFRPHGVMTVLGPFNFPVHLPNGHIVPSLALGNTVVFKPSELTPAVGALYETCVREAGFPEGVFSVVQGERSVGAFLSAEAEVDGVLFTGSVATGTAIARANADRPGKILALELGGKNAAVVFDDADFTQALTQVAYGAFVTAGQRCSSTSRCLVQRSLLPRFSEALVDLAGKLKVGHYADEVFMGPLISEQARERFWAAVSHAPEEGAENLLEATEPATTHSGHYLGPSVHLVRKPQADSHYQRAELFGPDIALYAFDDDEQALALANDTPFGLVASVFTAKRERFEWLASRIRAGVINWNAPTVGASGKLPFGGVGLSGNHRPAGAFSALYCAWPVAILEGGAVDPGKPAVSAPGFPKTHGS